MPDAAWVVGSRYALAVACWDRAHGGRCRPLPAKIRTQWANVVGTYQRLRIGPHAMLIEAGKLRGKPDGELLSAFRDALKASVDPGSLAHDGKAVARANLVQCALDGFCPSCGDSLPCRACGLPVLKRGRGSTLVPA